MQAKPAQRLVLVGGGHAHVHVLKDFAMRPVPGLGVTLVSPRAYSTYSGMVPGVIAGQYRMRDAQIDVQALTARAGGTFVADSVVRVDAQQRRVHLCDRPPIFYDWLSLDIGARPSGTNCIAAGAPVAVLKPIEVAAEQIGEALDLAASSQSLRVVVVGAGAGGCEIAFAIAARIGEGGHVTVCDAADRPVATRNGRASRAVLRAFAAQGIEFVGEVTVVYADRFGVRLRDGRTLPATLVVWATGAAGPDLLARSGLPVDERGFVCVGDDLRCAEFPEIFAAGDCAVMASHPELPKAGVYAVRQGPVLSANLRAAATGGRLRRFRPQRQLLALLNTGGGRAILSRGSIAVGGRSAWRLKDFIDRRFVGSYARPKLDARAVMRPMVACGGCAAKVGADVLGRVLARLDIRQSEHVVVGLNEPDDAAVFVQPAGTLAVATSDAFPPFTDDLFLVGQVAANNAASDLYAMGAEGSAAIALVCVPDGDERLAEERLEQFLRGALKQLGELTIPLVGGHTIAGEQTIVGFSMHGCVEPNGILRKRGARVGDRLVLTKRLGTGVVLAAARAGWADADWVEAAHASMLRSNRTAMRLLKRHGVCSCADVTGFGLAGHLAEMLRASGVAARLQREAIPALPGALDLLATGWRSSFHATNERTIRSTSPETNGRSVVRELCVDPQTSGGLLAAVPPARLEGLRADFAAAGEEFFVIGEVTDGNGWEMTL
ncbi:MAG TPA: selenide, water dikinase SelD [Candidatus Binatia bacterium]|nr:selenide, water dikinase SelD [Candidatus Binatia bacterium]